MCSINLSCPDCNPEDGVLVLKLTDVECLTCESCGADWDVDALVEARNRKVSEFNKAIRLLKMAQGIAKDSD